MKSKPGALATVLVLIGGTATALQVSPSSLAVNATVDQPENISIQLSTGNQSAENMTLENRSYLSWSVQDFNLSANTTRNVTGEALFQTRRDVNTSLQVPYTENGTQRSEEIQFAAQARNPDTSIEVSVFRSEFELEFNESGASVIEVSNTGNETARNVTLRGEDVNFARQGFDVPPDGDELVEYSVRLPLPEENRTEATNQTYNRSVDISGFNFPARNFSVSVFVPFQEYDPLKEEERNLRLLRQVQEFCTDNPDATLCGGEFVQNNTVIRNRTVTEYRALLDEEDGEEFRQVPEQVNRSLTRLLDQQQQQIELLNRTIQEQEQQLERELEEDRNAAELVNKTQQKKVAATKRALLWSIGGAVLVSFFGIFGSIVYTGYKFTNSRRDRRLGA